MAVSEQLKILCVKLNISVPDFARLSGEPAGWLRMKRKASRSMNERNCLKLRGCRYEGIYRQMASAWSFNGKVRYDTVLKKSTFVCNDLSCGLEGIRWEIKAYYRIGLTWSSNALEGNTLTE